MANNLNQAFIQNNQDNLVEDAPNVAAPNVTLVANEVRQIPNNNSVNADMSMAVDVAPRPFNNVSTIAPNNTMYNVASNYNNNNMSSIAPNNNRNRNFINMGGARRRTRRHRVKVRKTHRRYRQSRMRHRR